MIIVDREFFGGGGGGILVHCTLFNRPIFLTCDFLTLNNRINAENSKKASLVLQESAKVSKDGVERDIKRGRGREIKGI